jgi:CysZ protein
MFKNIVNGIQAYFGAFGLISKLKLWKYFAVPMIISVVTAVVIGLSAYGFSDNLGAYLLNIWPWEYGLSVVEKILTIFSGLIIIVLGLIVYKHIILALSAPFMSPVSEIIESHLTNTAVHSHRNTSFNSQLWRGIRLNVRNLFMELALTIPILLLGLLPVIGIFSTVLLFLVQAYYAGFGNMDYTLERHFNYKDSLNFVRKHRGIAIGNGIVFMLFLLIPVIGIILVLPLSVTAASTKTIGLLNTQNVYKEP